MHGHLQETRELQEVEGRVRQQVQPCSRGHVEGDEGEKQANVRMQRKCPPLYNCSSQVQGDKWTSWTGNRGQDDEALLQVKQEEARCRSNLYCRMFLSSVFKTIDFYKKRK